MRGARAEPIAATLRAHDIDPRHFAERNRLLDARVFDVADVFEQQRGFETTEACRLRQRELDARLHLIGCEAQQVTQAHEQRRARRELGGRSVDRAANDGGLDDHATHVETDLAGGDVGAVVLVVDSDEHDALFAFDTVEDRAIELGDRGALEADRREQLGERARAVGQKGGGDGDVVGGAVVDKDLARLIEDQPARVGDASLLDEVFF